MALSCFASLIHNLNTGKVDNLYLSTFIHKQREKGVKIPSYLEACGNIRRRATKFDSG